MNNFYVYMYFDPDTNEPFYIGKGQNDRYRDISGRKYNSHLYNKIQKIRKNKKLLVRDFTKFLYEGLTSDQAFSKEVDLIKFYGRQDLNTGPLLNLTEGGDGVVNPSWKVLEIVNDIENVLELSKTLSIKELAKRYGCGEITIIRACKKAGVKLPIGRKKIKGATKVEKIANIIDEVVELSKTLSIKELAKHYGCGTSTITNACKLSKTKLIRGRHDIDEQNVVVQYEKEKSIMSLATKYNCDRDVIIRILKKNNIQIVDGRKVSIFRGGLKK